jgi:hypothetical protein
VKTLYHDRLGLNKTFTFDGLTYRGADKILAYGRLSPLFNCTVAQYFYTRHRIRLQYPYLPCVVEKFTNGEDRFYPLELLELLWTSPTEDELSLYLGDMFKEVEIERKKCEDCGQLRGPTHLLKHVQLVVSVMRMDKMSLNRFLQHSHLTLREPVQIVETFMTRLN